MRTQCSWARDEACTSAAQGRAREVRTAYDELKAVQSVMLLFQSVRLPPFWKMPPPPCRCTATRQVRGGAHAVLVGEGRGAHECCARASARGAHPLR